MKKGNKQLVSKGFNDKPIEATADELAVYAELKKLKDERLSKGLSIKDAYT